MQFTVLLGWAENIISRLAGLLALFCGAEWVSNRYHARSSETTDRLSGIVSTRNRHGNDVDIRQVVLLNSDAIADAYRDQQAA